MGKFDDIIEDLRVEEKANATWAESTNMTHRDSAKWRQGYLDAVAQYQSAIRILEEAGRVDVGRLVQFAYDVPLSTDDENGAKNDLKLLALSLLGKGGIDGYDR